MNFISVEILGRVCEPQEIPQTQIGAAIATENVEIYCYFCVAVSFQKTQNYLMELYV